MLNARLSDCDYGMHARRLYLIGCSAFVLTLVGSSAPTANARDGGDQNAPSQSRGRPIQKAELNQLLRDCLRRPPSVAELELYTVEHRQPIPKKELEERVRRMVTDLAKSGSIPAGTDLAQAFDINFRVQLALQSKPRVTRERWLVKGDATRRDWVSSDELIDVDVKVDTPFIRTYILPGSVSTGDGRFYIYWHNLKSASRTKYNKMRQMRPMWDDLFGLDKLILEVLAVAVSELPKERAKGFGARDLKLDPTKIQTILAGKGDLQLFVSDIPVDSGPARKRVVLYTPSTRSTFADVIVDATDFAKVYEQNQYDRDGNRILEITATGFDASAIPREKTWTKQLPSGPERTELAVLAVSVNEDIPTDLFEFNPPEGYLASEIGEDGRAIRPAAAQHPATEPLTHNRPIWQKIVMIAPIVCLIVLLCCIAYQRIVRKRT